MGHSSLPQEHPSVKKMTLLHTLYESMHVTCPRSRHLVHMDFGAFICPVCPLVVHMDCLGLAGYTARMVLQACFERYRLLSQLGRTATMLAWSRSTVALWHC
jgi:hypothetical protein